MPLAELENPCGAEPMAVVSLWSSEDSRVVMTVVVEFSRSSMSLPSVKKYSMTDECKRFSSSTGADGSILELSTGMSG